MPRSLKTPVLPLLLLSLLLAHPVLAEAPAWANYTVTFESIWSAETHPLSFPPSPHFSGLIGGTHNDSVVFWAEDELASTGIKQMAEWGSKNALQGEVQTAIGAGQAGAVISGGGIGLSPGQVTTSFALSPEFPLVTITTMIAPSPDWFVGVAGLNLLQGETWLNELVVTLYPYDAGTDSGSNYTSGDQATNPADPISAIVSGPLAPGEPIGTLTFRLDAAAAAPLPVAAVNLTARPNPFNPTTVFHYEIPASAQQVQLSVIDVRGRVVRRLTPGTGPGLHATNWNGRSDSGVPSASGVYFARLEIDGTAVVHKVALVQ